MDENLREEAGCLYYRDKLALNFCLKKAHRVQVLDRNATPCGMLYRLELKLSGVQWAKEYCTALGEIENGGFFKAHADCHPKRPPVPYYPASVSHIIRPAINHYSTVLLT